MNQIFKVLFLCTGNSARSIMAEAVLNRVGQGRFEAYSAGSYPTGKVNPFAAQLLANRNHDLSDARSKSWDEFAVQGAPQMDFIITVCDNAAGEVCPIWPGEPVVAHWGFPDPAAVEGGEEEKRLAFAEVYRELYTRMEILVSLPMEQLDGLALQKRIRALSHHEREQA